MVRNCHSWARERGLELEAFEEQGWVQELVKKSHLQELVQELVDESHF